MREKFIYVFDESSRDKLLSLNYNLLKSDEREGFYVFYNKQTQNFSKNDFYFVLSDTITF